MTLFDYALAALGAVAGASGAAGGHPASLAIDGSDVSYWQNSGGSQKIWVDLGASQYITECQIRHNGNLDSQLTPVTIEYSVDNVTWYTLNSFASVRWENSYATGGLTARYWRFACNYGGAWWQVYAMRVLGPVPAPPPPTAPAPDYIEAWLDGLEANYVPTVEDWLAANP